MTGDAINIALIPDKAFERGSDESAIALLVSRARSGDAAAFEELMIASQRRVVSVAWRMLGDREDARDAAQEAFLRAYRYLDRFDTDQDFSAWMYAITINVCRDLARKRGGCRLASIEDHDRLAALASPDDSEAGAILSQKREIVARALASLPEKERAALVLRDLEGLDTAEVARVLGTRPVTVRSQVSTARAKVKRYCERFLRQARKE